MLLKASEGKKKKFLRTSNRSHFYFAESSESRIERKKPNPIIILIPNI